MCDRHLLPGHERRMLLLAVPASRRYTGRSAMGAEKQTCLFARRVDQIDMGNSWVPSPALALPCHHIKLLGRTATPKVTLVDP
ncbi:unnamed protein product [Ectocarpus sp. 6 AP-2014]